MACAYSNSFSNNATVKLLLEHNANINIQNFAGWTCLMTSSRYSNNDSNNETVKLLLDNKADVNMKNNHGSTSLMMASRYSNDDSNNETVKLLLENKADVDIKNNNNFTALIMAIKYSNCETVKLLLKYGADIKNLVDIDVANSEIIKILLEQGYTNFLNNKYEVEFLEELCLIRLYDYNFCKKFFNVISNDFIEKIYNYNYYYKFIKKNIINTRNEIYEKPNNILSLCYEYEFNKKTTKQIPEKLIKLFDIKNEKDCDTKCDFYLKN